MSGGSSRPLDRGDNASAAKRPSGTHSIAAWWALASSSLEYHTPTMCLPDCHAASLASPSPTTARHCAPTRSSAVMPTVKPTRAAWPAPPAEPRRLADHLIERVHRFRPADAGDRLHLGAVLVELHAEHEGAQFQQALEIGGNFGPVLGHCVISWKRAGHPTIF